MYQLLKNHIIRRKDKQSSFKVGRVSETHSYSLRETRPFRSDCCVHHEQSEVNLHDNQQTYSSKIITTTNEIIKNKERREHMRRACHIQVENKSMKKKEKKSMIR